MISRSPTSQNMCLRHLSIRRAAGPQSSKLALKKTERTVKADSDPRVVRGQKIYNERCYFCHGYSGDAKPLAASYLNPPPRAFTTSAPAKLSRAKMIAAVPHGLPGTAMQSI